MEKKKKTRKPFFRSPFKIILTLIVLVIAVLLGITFIPITIENIRFNALDSWDIIANMDPDSFTASGNGYTFTSKDYDGNTITMYGEGISLTEDGIEMQPMSFIYSLDAVGAIEAYSFTLREYDESSYLYLAWGGGYTFSEVTSVDSHKDLFRMDGFGIFANDFADGHPAKVEYDLRPNFVNVWTDNGSEYPIVLTGLTVHCDAEIKTTKLGDVALDTDFYGFQLEGTPYNAVNEGKADPENQIYDFYLFVAPDNGREFSVNPSKEAHIHPISCPAGRLFTVGALRDAEGNELDKATAVVEAGMTLDVTIGDYTACVEIPVVPRYTGANKLSELIPYGYAEANGKANVLVVPIYWADEAYTANDETLDLFRVNLGRVAPMGGSVTDYSDPDEDVFSVSEYFDTVSYGKYSIDFYMTDWYFCDENFMNEMEFTGPYYEHEANIFAWVKETYPDTDWTKFDLDEDGYADAVIFINAGQGNTAEVFTPYSYGGAVQFIEKYTPEYAGTPDNPGLNNHFVINKNLLETEGALTIVHEYGHSLGLIDYYDVGYTGIDALGSYDMQSGGLGDWNPYSKYAVGWLEPEIVTGLAAGESVEIEIGASVLTNDAIVIPSANSVTYDGTPFSEYIIIDLFASESLHKENAGLYSLEGVNGVRIYHVNAMMERHTQEWNGETYDIGTPHVVNTYSADGRYHIELIQSGGVNTFTCLEDLDALYPQVSPDDLFYAGDTFAVEDYAEFFGEGRMDDGSEFGYIVEIVSINEGENGPTATIRITAY